MKPWSESIHFPAPLREVRVMEEEEREQRLDEQLQESYERGLRDGERRLGEQLVRQRSEMFELQSGVFASLQQTLPKVIADNQDSLVTLAFQVAEKLVSGMPITVEMVEGVVLEALLHVQQTTDYQILLNPADLELLKKFDSPTAKQWTQSEGVTLQPSLDVTRGGCIVQTRFGTVDARRETKLALLQDTIQS